MSDVPGLPSDVYFGGSPIESLPDWRADNDPNADDDPDDEPLAKTPPDVVAVLGFDPLDVDDPAPAQFSIAEEPDSAIARADRMTSQSTLAGNEISRELRSRIQGLLKKKLSGQAASGATTSTPT